MSECILCTRAVERWMEELGCVEFGEFLRCGVDVNVGRGLFEINRKLFW